MALGGTPSSRQYCTSRKSSVLIKTRLLALLAFCSGCSALVYQVAWLRMLRLIFGTSTAASAAVMAVFLGGLGFGAFFLGRRADRAENPLRLYAIIEFGIALSAALTPVLTELARMAYVGLGGTLALGTIGGTVVRLLLSTLVLGVPTFLMGGTLPVMARGARSTADVNRRSLGALYGMNTLGAVIGTLAATFVVLEMLGTRATVWAAAVLNVIVAVVALSMSRVASHKRAASSDDVHVPSDVAHSAPAWLVMTAAGIVGFVFLLMELVWYRMLTPLLGGSSYTFGLILAVALLGIGIGGLSYAIFGRRPTTLAFAFTCALEGLLLALPFAFGDRVALFALGERQGAATFGSIVWGWLLVTAAVVFPAAALSGYQFPLLVGLLGKGRKQLGADIGKAYAANSGGAIAGSLAGGFGLIPLLSAPRVWQCAVFLLVGLAVVVAIYSARKGAMLRSAVLVSVPTVIAVACCFALGPTPFWRDSPIGAGRVRLALTDGNAVQRALNMRRLETLWDVDGIESAVSLDRANGISFYVNGKSDGSAIGDAATQVMLGLLGSMLHPDPKRALVIGLGTGETAGWLAQVPSIERVDVYELEPALLRIADACALANQNVLSNPKVHVILGDARELLLTGNTKYDVIASEPSNPYRAGVSSLFTREFYSGVTARLNRSGIFVQWVQAYEVKSDAMRTIVATLHAVFPFVETWELMLNKDLAFVASRDALVHDLSRVRSRAETEPYRTAMSLVWGVGGPEGLYSGMLGNSEFANDFAKSAHTAVNTDDRTYLEFAFARSVGDTAKDLPGEMRQSAINRDHRAPHFVNGALDWNVVEERRLTRAITEAGSLPDVKPTEKFSDARQTARYAYAEGDLGRARAYWVVQKTDPIALGDLRMVAESYAAAGDSSTLQFIEQLRPLEPVEAEALMAVFSNRTNNHNGAVDHLINALTLYRSNPWANRALIERAFDVIGSSVRGDLSGSRRLFAALKEPFAVRALDVSRLQVRSFIGLGPGFEKDCVEALVDLEPNVPWDNVLLQARYQCYEKEQSPLAPKAKRDLEKFLSH
ncbi:MAG TPA: fused MFS/spermidine synthase [Gemmatimonadaceae bacterium]|nr:fused MFS/spermidine synthase [Gemmatimonadaceae bacterium]